MVDVVRERWSGSARTLSGTSQIVGGDPYELRIAGLGDPDKNWKLASATVSADDKAPGVTIAAKPIAAGEEGWVRVVINSQSSRPVNWSLKFTTERRP